MWKSSLTFMIAVLLTTPVFAQAEGKWTGKIPGPGSRDSALRPGDATPNAGTVTAEFKVNGSKLTGIITFDDGRPIEISDGSMIGPQVSFLATRGGLTDRYTGDVKGDELALRRDRVMAAAPPQSEPTPPGIIIISPLALKRVQ